jgi:hypothetical protein
VEAEKALKAENKGSNNMGGVSDAEFREFFMKTGCPTVEKAMDLFKDDELFHKPGTHN